MVNGPAPPSFTLPRKDVECSRHFPSLSFPQDDHEKSHGIHSGSRVVTSRGSWPRRGRTCPRSHREAVRGAQPPRASTVGNGQKPGVFIFWHTCWKRMKTSSLPPGKVQFHCRHDPGDAVFPREHLYPGRSPVVNASCPSGTTCAPCLGHFALGPSPGSPL